MGWFTQTFYSLWIWIAYAIILVIVGERFQDEIAAWVIEHVPYLSFLDNVGNALGFIIAIEIGSNRQTNYERLQLITTLRRVAVNFKRRAVITNNSEEVNGWIAHAIDLIFHNAQKDTYVDVFGEMMSIMGFETYTESTKNSSIDAKAAVEFAQNVESIYFNFRNLKYRDFSTRVLVFQYVLLAIYIGLHVLLFHARNTLWIGIMTTFLFVGAFIGLAGITRASDSGDGGPRFQHEERLALGEFRQVGASTRIKSYHV